MYIQIFDIILHIKSAGFKSENTCKIFQNIVVISNYNKKVEEKRK